MTSKILCGLAVSSLLIASCGNPSTEKEHQSPPKTKPLKGVNISYMDTTVQPCEDFYQYVNGTWIKENPIPDTESRWSGFNEVKDRNNDILKKILEKSQKTKAEAGSNMQKIGDYYNIAMDTVKLNKEGISPLAAEIKMIDEMQSTNDLMKVLAHQHQYGIGTLLSFGIDQDMKENTQYIAMTGQGGLGLPDRDFYLKDDEQSAGLRKMYITHIDKIIKIAGMGEDFSTPIMKIETALAKASMTNVERRNYEIQYNKMTIDEFKEKSPNLNWSLYLTDVGLPNIKNIIVGQPLFIDAVNKMAKSVSIDDWKKYFKWNLINSTASFLSADIDAQNFDFYARTLSGAKEMKKRWKRVLRAMDRDLGEVLGQEYVKIAFKEETKKRLDGLVDNLMVSFKERISGLEWMSEETKVQALKKLGTFTRKLGYPDKWRDYSSLTIDKESFVMNHLRANYYEYKRMINKLGKPVDKTEWGMSPQTVNAYYNPLNNEIVFPAGILQPPFLDPEADDAILYATIGAIIGHEVTHGFDDKGSGFDAEGNLKNWWSENDLQDFQERAAVVKNQYDSYEPLEGLHINGALTMGENIADIGGLAVAFNAYENSLKGKERKKIDGFTPEQRFFIAFGQVWKGLYRDAALRQQLLTNPHSPNQYRVIGTLSSMPQFYEAFGCKSGDLMYREDSVRANIW